MFPEIDIDKVVQTLSYNPKEPLLFNSGFFLYFFFAFFLFYQFVYRHKLTRVIVISIFSLYFFYKACGIYFLFILLAAVVDFNLSNWIFKTERRSKKKFLLVFSVVINLGLLVFFKYSDMFIQTLNDLRHQSWFLETFLPHMNPADVKDYALLNLVLPIGISFYTFENISYTIDVYRGAFKPVKRFIDYLFFLSFFPKLVMGPIVRASDFIPQIRQDIYVTRDDVGRGLYLIISGLFKKVVVSDYLTVNYVEMVFDDPSRFSGIECLFGVYGYAMVIYCDFSGYSDMAIGMAKWMGFTIPENFDSPYQSSSITEFWRRWHISLSSWLKDYLYIPLGGGRKGKFRQYFNLIITMLIGGLWHGASWTFVVWGGLHGVMLAIDKLFKEHVKLPKNWFIKFLGVVLTFHFVCFCWIFFKAKSFGDANTIITQIATNFNAQAAPELFAAYSSVLGILLLGFVMHFTPQKLDENFQRVLISMPAVGRFAVLMLFIWIAIQVKNSELVKPVYLQF